MRAAGGDDVSRLAVERDPPTGDRSNSTAPRAAAAAASPTQRAIRIDGCAVLAPKARLRVQGKIGFDRAGVNERRIDARVAPRFLFAL